MGTSIGDALRDATSRLQRVGGTGALDAARLLEHVTRRDRAALIAHAGDLLGADSAARFAALVARRDAGEPIAYITGSAGFYGRTFLVDERVLVPRPESEHLIEAALDDLRGRKKTNGIAVDVGCGSGALGITLACELENLAVYAIDVSPGALSVTRRNAALNHVFQRVTILGGDLLAPLARFDERVDCIIANLPYIPTAAVPPKPDPVGFEPLVALDGGSDGLDLYRRLLEQLPAVSAPGASVFMEAAPGTLEPLAVLAAAAFPAAHIEVGEDYAGCERFVVMTL
ncbi:MAG: peptide chain release factor N(5)-glutamine methyltransferase [Candidatus Velthaea sp.]